MKIYLKCFKALPLTNVHVYKLFVQSSTPYYTSIDAPTFIGVFRVVFKFQKKARNIYFELPHYFLPCYQTINYQGI